MTHWPVLPILLPLVTAAALVLLERIGLWPQRLLALLATAAQLLLAFGLLHVADQGEVVVYLLGDWPARLGIALALDRLSALMLVTTAFLAFAGVVYSIGGWDERAPHFHALFQFQLMGLNGAFLTADLFNLFVFFEVLLIASYGLMLSGGRGLRLRAGLHYVAFNISASTLYLFAIGLLYGLLGALNMGEMAARISAAPATDLPLIAAAGGMLLVVFCAKAALFPLALWLPETYARTPAAVMALFAVMTKLGVYAVVRVYSSLFGADAGELAGYVWPWVLPLAAIGLALATLGALAAHTLRRLAGYLVIASAATLFIAIAVESSAALGAGLYYLVHSSLAAAALFLLADMVRRRRHSAGDRLYQLDHLPGRGWLGAAFAFVAMWIVGLPPLAGFLGKLSLLAALPESVIGWAWPLILTSSLLILYALAQAGSALFWRHPQVAAQTPAPMPQRWQWAALLWLVFGGLGLVAGARGTFDYTAAAAAQLDRPAAFRDALLQASPASPSTGATP